MKLLNRLALGVALALTTFSLFTVAIAGETASKSVKLLAIGNSFSGNATHYLPEIVKAGGDTFTLKQIAIGGCPLETHWRNAAAFQQGATNQQARAWALLTAEKWDFVTLQQVSIKSFKVETYRPFAKQLHDYIKTQAPTAEVVIHETWAYREDDPLFKKDFTQLNMHWELCKAYETIAGELGCRIIPVGDAFQNARADAAWGAFVTDAKFDYKNAKPPTLPDQTHSLNAGYHWKTDKTGKSNLELDGHHANTAGEYLAAAVWYEFLFGHSIVGNTFVPKGLSAADIAVLQRIAHQTVTEGLKPKQ
ncbi:MAG: DUF4886 domain-containing protein [Verrucomicrobiota bacterium]